MAMQRKFVVGSLDKLALTRSSADAGLGTELNFTGHAAVFNQPTLIGSRSWGFVEWLENGAFDDVLEDDTRYLFNHDGMPLARTTNGTLRLTQDKVGLSVDADLADVQLSRDLAVLIERGDITQMSFAFSPGQFREGVVDLADAKKAGHDSVELPEEMDGLPYVVHTRVKKLWDVSAVTYPAYEGTDAQMNSIRCVKGDDDEIRSVRERNISAPARSDLSLRVKILQSRAHARIRLQLGDRDMADSDLEVRDDDLSLVASFTYSEEKALLEKRAAAWEEMKTIKLDGDVSAEDVARAEALDADIDRLSKALELGRKRRAANSADADVVAERKERTGKGADEHDQLFRKYLMFGVAAMERDEIQRLMKFADTELRVQNTIQGSAGGFLVPDGFWNRLVSTQKQYGPIESVVNSITTSTGADLPWLTEDDTANEGELLNEGDTVGTQDIAFGVKVLRAFTYSSKMIKISWQLMQDSAIDLEGLIARKAGIRLGRIHSRHFTIGTGTNQPEGIAVGLTGGKTFASATVVTHDELIDVQHIIDPAYRNGNQMWMLNDATLKGIRKVVDGQGNKAWQPGLVAGMPDQILGDPYVVNQNMPLPTTGNVSILYGDFSVGYTIRRVKGATAVRMNEKFADQLQTGYFVYDRMDGKKDDTNAYSYGVQA